MKIYKYDVDVNNYFGMILERPDRMEISRLFEGKPAGDKWKKIEFTWATGKVYGKKKKKHGDAIAYHRYAPVLTKRAVDALEDLLKPNGELLPFENEGGGKYYAYNITTVVDALNEEESEIERYSNGSILMVWKYVFFSEKIGNTPVFKLASNPTYYPFVSEEFVIRVQEHKLLGFKFDPVWEG